MNRRGGRPAPLPGADEGSRGSGELRPTAGRRLLVPLVGLVLATAPVPALAQGANHGHAQDKAGASGTAEDHTKAQRHFQRAKELYQSGNYREAVAELEIARKLDPKAKDLVMNLGIVHEKLGKYDEAVGYFKTYLEMEGVTPAERTKAEGIIKRLEGAKKELRPPPSPPPAEKTTTPPPSPPPAEAPPPRRGRVDALTIAFGSIAAVGLVGGASLGVYALASRPSGFVTGRDGSYQDLKDQTDGAHTAAIVADVGLGVGVVAAAVAAGLYFGRTKEAPPKTKVSAAPLPSGGAVLVGGSF